MPGTETSCGLVTTSRSTDPGWVKAACTAESTSWVLYTDGVEADRSGDGGEVGVRQPGSELGQACLLLFELDHAEPAVVEDD